MRKFAVVADSTCDLGKELREKFNIDYVKMNYVIDGKEYPASLDWESHSAKEFYDIMRGGKRIFTTQVPREEFVTKFTEYIEKDMDVLYISCSSALSASINLGRIVAKELSEEYPQAKILCVDSLISSLGQGHLAIEAAKMRDAGASLDDVAQHIENIRLNMNQCGTPESLEYLKRAGRVTASSAFFGNLFGIKPILISDIKGKNYACKKVKGALNAKREIAKMVNEYATEDSYDCLYISHSDSQEEAEKLRDEILKTTPFRECYLSYIGPIVGASVGPGTICAYCYGKEVTIEGRE